MSNDRHGISVGIERSGSKFYMTFVAVGKLTHEDYEYMVPMLESAIAGVEDPEINVLADISELDGWELRAAWDDLKLGVAHGKAFEKIAIVGEGRLQEWMAKLADWFTPYDAKFFESKKEARDWLND
ncbi:MULTISPECIES: STAS/SEC14 domain-containing protein [unclassified Shewanella]|uniref:STAS/SEC14 domain-containing protein n=1 Tax=unclassified Shewanella TaxID=196818 RepID=UPI001BBADD03|nr:MULTISPECIES: STAS/SEC14 domain-containing protein [unclassified Shewanella]GIU05468.1 STAS/SEC14 domain-containing protein [Shewanella sp. MBTL60-112-B1]GIU23970.1 STAS/SEC14 domain-containing protein [Shewanella sp. MBTL60-112-B2]